MNKILQYNFRSGKRFAISLLTALLVTATSVLAINRVSVSSGNYSDAANWSPYGVPYASDKITIKTSHIITVDAVLKSGAVIIEDGGSLVIAGNNKLLVHGSITINGTAEIVEGNLELVHPYTLFRMGPKGKLTWDPADNTSSGASLFLNGEEDFHPTSTLIIKKWYNYSNTPLGSVVSGNFGNLILSTLSNGLLFEWNQQNQFENHKIFGTLTIDQGWIILDKTGSINNTSIGAIKLNNINSYLDFHYGDHPNEFTVKTSSIVNIGGTLNGLVNGNGNINIEVAGDFENLGKVALIYNSGVQGTSNGNATLKTNGKYKQTHGDFRGVFNITTTSSGIANLEFGELDLKGGVFMAQYGCHVLGGTTVFKVNGNLNVNFENSNAIFRVNGLTSLTGIKSNLQLQMIVDGNLLVNGKPASEFTSSASSGMEQVMVNGDTRFDGGKSNFNLGEHVTELSFKNNLTVSGGEVYLSKTKGTLLANVGNNLNINAGKLIVKGETGHSNLHIRGNYEQTGGSFNLYNNINVPASHIIYVTISGEFSMHSGTINFDTNTLSTVAHHLSLNGKSFQIGVQASINQTLSAQNPVYGTIYYDRIGKMYYHFYGNTAMLKNIKQVVSSGCTLIVKEGNLMVAAANTNEKDMLKISDGGVLDLGANHIYSNLQGLYSGVTIWDNGRLMTMNSAGLYDGTMNASIHPMGNMMFFLNPTSTVEYYGEANQIITGTGIGNAQTPDQQYGIIEINKSGGKAILNASNVDVRTSLFLNKGELDLNNYDLNIHSGKSHAITRNLGYIKSEPSANSTGGMVHWKNIEEGNHTIPFGISTTKVLPLSFSVQTGKGRTFSASTRQSQSDNRPMPIGVTNITLEGTSPAVDKIIDRWYYIAANGIKADVTISYLPEENTTIPSVATNNFSAIVWNDPNWKIVGGTGNGTVTTMGEVSVRGLNTWGHLLLISNKVPNMAELLSFDASLDKGHVNLKWVSKVNIDAEKYIVERSSDGHHFESLATVVASTGNQPQTHTLTDKNPIQGVSYYRIKQVQVNQNTKYSEQKKIDTNSGTIKEIEILSVGPNPFTNEFTVLYYLPTESDVTVKLMHANGSVVYQVATEGLQGRNTLKLDNNWGLSKGLYIVSVSNGTSFSQTKILKF